MRRPADDDAKQRALGAIALLLLGVFVAFLPAIVAGDEFLRPEVDPAWVASWMQHASITEVRGSGGMRAVVETNVPIFLPSGPTSLVGLATTDVSWAVVVVSLLVAPGLFVAWRRSAITFGRVAGVACCVAATTAVCAIVQGQRDESLLFGARWCTVPIGGALMAAAFLVAPPPRRRDE